MKKYLETLISEKGIDMETPIQAEGPSGTNYMVLQNVVDAIVATCASEQRKIKETLIKIDFLNGDIMHFFKHLAQAIAI